MDRGRIHFMCRMIAAPRGVPGSLLIEPFMRLAQGRNTLNEINTVLGQWTHLESWGAVYERDGELVSVRRTRSCVDDPELERLRDEKVFLLHARKASSGAVCLDNTHPFSYDLNGARWFFSHNGTVKDPLTVPETLNRDGSTDSERVFHRLLPFVETDPLYGVRKVYRGFHDFTCLNSFLMGPNTLWTVCFHTENPNYYTFAVADLPSGPVIASEPLADVADVWMPMANERVLAVDRTTGEKTEYPL